MKTIADYEAWKARQQQSNVGAAQVVLEAADASPDEVASDLTLAGDFSKATGGPVPPLPLVKEHRNVFQAAIERHRNTTILSNSPRLTEWLRNRENAALARDDLEGLSWWETTLGAGQHAISRGIQSFPQSYRQWLAAGTRERGRDQERSFAEIYADERSRPLFDWGPLGNSGLIDTAIGPISDAVFAGSRYLMSRLSALVGGSPEEHEARAAEYQRQAGEIAERIAAIPMSPAGERGKALVQSFKPTGSIGEDFAQFFGLVAKDPAGFLAFLTETAVESAPAIAAATVGTLATRSPGVGATILGLSSGAREAGSAPVEFFREHGLDVSTPDGALEAVQNEEMWRDAMQRGMTRGVIIGILDGLSGGIAGQQLANSPLANLALQSVVQAGLGAGGEAAGQIASGQEFNLAEVLIEGLAEFVTAPIEVAGVGGRAFVDNQRKARDAEARRTLFQELSGQAVSSKLRERMPDKFREFVEAATKDGPVEHVYVPAKEFVTYFQDIGVDPWALVDEELDGVTRDDLDAALAGGGDLQIPTATYAAKIAGSEHDAFLMENMRFDPDQMTAREAAEFNARAQEAMEEAWQVAEELRRHEEEFRSFEQEIYDTMVSRLRAAGRSTEVATTEAMLYPAFYRVMAERSNLTIEEFLQRYPLPQVQGAIPQGFQFRDVDELNRTLAEARNRKTVRDSRMTLLEFIDDRGGINDVGGELRARDAETIRRGRGKKTLRLARPGFVPGQAGIFGVGETDMYSPDSVAHAAIEYGYMADDPIVIQYKTALERGDQVPDITRALWDAIDRELGGEPQYSAYAPVDPAIAENEALDQIEEYLASLGVSLYDDDATIKAAIQADREARHYGQFAGVRARTLDSSALERAQAMEADGELPGDIYGATGFFKGPDGLWRFEISDADAKLKMGMLDRIIRKLAPKYVPLSSVLDHPKLFAAYPQLASYRTSVKIDPDAELLGAHDGENRVIEARGRTPEEALSVLLHEVAHAIQTVEDFATGGNPSMGELYEGERVAELKASIRQLGEAAEAAYEAGDKDRLKWIADRVAQEKQEMVKAARFEYYRRLAGEVEARNVQARDKLRRSGEEPDAPWWTADVTSDKVIIVRSRDRGDAFKALSADQGDPNAGRAGMPDWMRGILEGSRQRKALAAELAADGKAVRLKHADGRSALAGPDMSSPGGFRLTRFDDDGPVGHTEHSSLADAIDEGLRAGYQPVGRSYDQSGDERNLIVQHNLTAANLLHADKMRGLAVPSLAISNVDHPLDNFGEITLLGGPDLIDPRKDRTSKVFDADVYSPRYPTVRYKIAKAAMNKVWKRLGKVSAELGHVLSGELDSGEVERKGLEAFRDSSAVQLQFLRDTGRDIELPQQTARTDYLKMVPELADKFIDSYAVNNDPETRALVEKAISLEIQKLRDAAPDIPVEEWRDQYYRNGEIRRSVIDDIRQEIRVAREPGVDRYAARTAIRDAVKPHADEFSAWVEEQFGSVIAGETIMTETASGNWRYLPHTLDNVVKVLRKKLRDGEGFNYGVGSIRSKVANQFKSVSAIQRARGRLIPADAMQALKDEVNDEFVALASKLGAYSEYSSGFGWLDTFSEQLKEVADRGPRALNQYFNDLPDDLLQEAVAFLDKLANMPTEYFEAKLQRAVDLSEFKAAVVPHDAPQAAKDVLKRAGVPIFEYDPKDASSRAVRTRLAASEGKLLFQSGRDQAVEDQPRVNEDGFVQLLPFREEWGDPRFNEEDREHALGRLREIRAMNVRQAPWEDIVAAYRDLNQIAMQLLYFAPDAPIEKLRDTLNGGHEVWRYMFDRRRGPDLGDDGRSSIYSGINVPPDIQDFAREGGSAIEHLLKSRRRGVVELLEFGWTDEPRPSRKPLDPSQIGEKMRSGFYFQVGRKLADVPDALFNQGGQAVIDWLTQAGVSRAEIDHFQLQQKFGNRQPATREDFARAIAERMFDFRRKTSWLNPERTRRDYELGGTRAFGGPRIPGRGIYFERLNAFPKKLKGGEEFPPGSFESPHWEDVHTGTWASWRGSIRDIPNWGRMLIGEEGQTDYMQGAVSGRRPRITTAEYLKLKDDRDRRDKVLDKAYDLVGTAASAIGLSYQQKSAIARELVPLYGGSELDRDAWLERAKSFRDLIRERGNNKDAIEALDELEKLRSDNEEFFKPGARELYDDPAKFTPETPLDESYTRNMIRDLLLLAAQRNVNSIAISTSETTDRIQANTHRSAAHFYDRQLKPGLERELRRWTGDSTLKLELVKLPKAMGAPRNEKAYTVWAARLTPEVLARIRAQGLPMMQDTGEAGRRGSIQFPAGGVGRGDTVIRLFQGADLSTMLHESGHYFLSVMQDLAANGEEQATADLAAIRVWWRSNADSVAKDAMRSAPDVKITADDVIAVLDYGTTGDADKDIAIDTGMHEQWARAFEAYLMEGKAPSAELRSAFEKFRAWLISVYRRLVGLNVAVSDDIRAVMDRMLATDEEIAKAQAEAGGTAPLFATAEEMGLSPEEFSAFLKLRSQAEDEAKARLLREIMAPIKRERDKWYKEERAKVRKEVEREVNAYPYYRAIEWLGNRRWLGDDPPLDDTPDLRLSKAILVERYGEGVLKTLPRGKQTIYTVDGGLDPDDAAGWFGFDSGDEMIRALERAPKRIDAIEAETDRIMNERHGDVLNDGTIEAEALDAVHTDKRGQWIAAELKAVVEVAGTGDVMTAKAARETARRTIARMRVRDAMNANRFLAAERKAGEEAARLGAMLAREKLWMDAARRRIATKARAVLREDGKPDAVAGQIDRANRSTKNYNETVEKLIQAKRRQLLNHALYMEARKVADEVAKAERFVAKLSKKTTREKIAGAGRRENAQVDYLAAIDELLDRYDFRRLSGAAERRRGALNAFVEAMKAAGRENELAIPEAVLADAARKPYKTLPVEELRGVIDSLKNLEHVALRWDKLIDAQQQRALDDVVADIVEAFDANLPKRPPGRVPTSGEALRNAGRQFLDLVLNAGTILREIDGFADFGPAYRNIKAPIDEAMNRLIVRKQKAAADLEKLYSVYSKEERRRMSVREYMPALGYSLSKWERIAVALNTGNAGNLQRLTDPKVRGSLTEAQVAAVLATLDERDADFVQSVWDYIGSFRADIAARERRTTGVEPEWVEAQPVQIAGKTLKGGYYPLKYDPRLSSLARDDQTQEIAQSLQAGRFGKAQTRNGHLKERAQSSGRDVELDMSVLHRHVNQVIYDLELSEPVANSWRILQDGRIRSAFIEAGKQADFDALETWLKDVAEGELRSADFTGRAARILKSNFTAAKLAFNISTVAIQVTGLSQSMVVVGKKDFVRGVMASFRPGVVSDIVAKSPFMASRQTTFNKDIYDFYSDPKTGPVASRWGDIKSNIIGPLSFWMMTKVQWALVDVPTWLAGYHQGLRKFGKDEAKAIAHADAIVKRAQASGLFSDRSAVERGSVTRTARQNEVVRLFTALGSYMFAKFNVAYERSARASRAIRQEGVSLKSAQEALSWTLDMAFLFTLEAVILAAIRGGLPDQDDEENDSWLKFIAKETAFGVMATMPFVRDVAGPVQGYDGGGAYGAITKELGAPLVQIAQGEVDAALVKSVINATGLATGLPATQINRIVDAAWREAEGEDVSPVEYLMGRSRK